MFSKKDLTTIEGIMMLNAVSEHSSKRLAAKYLNVSLDTLDKYLHMLEGELGTKLLIATGRGCALTKSGTQILKNIIPLKKCISNIYLLKEVDAHICGEVNVVYDVSVRGNFPSSCIRNLFKNYPEITLRIESMSGTPDMSLITHDICLSYQIPKGEDLVVICSRQIPCKFFASAEYLKLYSPPRTLQDLILNHRLILRQDNWNELNYFAQLDEKQCRGVSLTNSAFVVSDVAANGGGIGVMPYYQNKIENRLICLDNLECPTSNTLYLVSHKTRKDIPKVRAVLNYYKEIIDNL